MVIISKFCEHKIHQIMVASVHHGSKKMLHNLCEIFLRLSYISTSLIVIKKVYVDGILDFKNNNFLPFFKTKNITILW